MKRKGSWTDEDLRTLEQAATDGVAVAEIARMLDRSSEAVRTAALAKGLALPRTGFGGRRMKARADDEGLSLAEKS